MLRNFTSLKGYSMFAKDGEIGKVADFYVDKKQWVIRYVVVETGHWYNSKQVLISPASILTPLWSEKTIPANLTREQIKHSPSADSVKPISRQREIELANYFGWPQYWTLGEAPAAPLDPFAAMQEPREAFDAAARAKRKMMVDETIHPELLSAADTAGYHIQANDGEIGRVDDLLLEDGHWTVRYLAVDTKNWLPGKKIIVPVTALRDIDWSERKAVTALSRGQIESAPEYNSWEPVSPESEMRFDRYYQNR